MAYTVRFEDVTKRYPRGGPRYASLRHDLRSGLRRLGRRLTRRGPTGSGTLALNHVSFDVEEGESFAIIGPNGAGKTTALKLVSRITYPTSGQLRVQGRVGALIEVGSGIHPELTARENIWLYGQILGMPRSEIRRRFDEIVEFAELQEVLDRSVKMFSSGMQLRLGFAIASHLDPDIFVVDEALAVGDASFRTKCVERMQQLVANGRSLIFVSHDLFALEAICSRGLLLLDGQVEAMGRMPEIVTRYTDLIDEGLTRRRPGSKFVSGRDVDLTSAVLYGLDGRKRETFEPGEGMEIRVDLTAKRRIENCWLSIGISNGRRDPLILCSMLEGSHGVQLRKGRCSFKCRMDSLPLAPRAYEVWFSLRDPSGTTDIIDWNQIGSFRVGIHRRVDGHRASASRIGGPIRVPHAWTPISANGGSGR